MNKKGKSQIKLGATVRLHVHSGEVVEGRVVHMWEEKSAPMGRVASGDLVYNVPGVACWSIERKFETKPAPIMQETAS